MNVPKFRFYERVECDLKGVDVDAYGKTHPMNSNSCGTSIRASQLAYNSSAHFTIIDKERSDA